MSNPEYSVAKVGALRSCLKSLNGQGAKALLGE